MRRYIFEFEQEVLANLHVTTSEALILDYLLKLYNYKYAKIKSIDNLRYIRIKYKKILSDLPILNITERQLRNILKRMCNKNVIKTYTHQNNELYIYVDFAKLFDMEYLHYNIGKEVV